MTVILTDFGPRVEESYLGDAVYASHDTLHIWLRSGSNEIALDVSTYRALVEYAKRVGLDRS